MTQTLSITELENHLTMIERGAAKGTRYLVFKSGKPIFRIEPPGVPQREKKYSFRDIIKMVEKLPKKRGSKTRYSLEHDEILYGTKA